MFNVENRRHDEIMSLSVAIITNCIPDSQLSAYLLRQPWPLQQASEKGTCVCVCVVGGRVYTCMQAHPNTGQQRNTLSILHYHSLLQSLEIGSLTDPEARLVPASANNPASPSQRQAYGYAGPCLAGNSNSRPDS